MSSVFLSFRSESSKLYPCDDHIPVVVVEDHNGGHNAAGDHEHDAVEVGA